jgi:hypothetical protein
VLVLDGRNQLDDRDRAPDPADGQRSAVEE